MGSQNLIAPGCADVVDLDYGVLTGHVLTEKVSETREVQRWMLLAGPPAFRAPPASRLRLQAPAEGSSWTTTDVEVWLELARSEWSSGCRFIKATFEAYSVDEYPSLPSDPVSSPGFPGIAKVLPTGVTTARRTLALPTQFDVGTSYFELAEGIRTWVYRFGPRYSDPSLEYWVLHRQHDPGAYPTMTALAADPESQYESVGAFATAMNAQLWGETAQTFMLGSCYEVTDPEALS